ncbi:MAG: biotin/lipoyl-containing protein [Saprospiraceae bacterium]|jgi:biotin carboxyl carrier protein
MSKNSPFQLLVDDQHAFQLQPVDAQSMDVISNGNNAFHAIKDGVAYHIEILERNSKTREYLLRVNGRNHRVQIADYYDRLIKEMGLQAGSGQHINELKAPMPGLVLDVLVEVGQEVSKGDSLLILEAMKMENVLKSPGEGKVKSIQVNKGQAVEKGSVLLDFE